MVLRRAIEFAQTEMPFIPKEAWQVAKTLSEVTGLAEDKEMFHNFDLMRKSGNEAVH